MNERRLPTRSEVDAADNAVSGAMRDMLYGPLDYSKRQFDRVAMLFMIEEEGPRHLRVSTDGAEPFQNVPKELIKLTAREGRFALAHLLGKHVIEFKFVQGRVPVLSKDEEWTAEEVAQWRNLRTRLPALRDALEDQRRRRKGLRKSYSRGRFGEGA
jgi:hypothetical protein